MIKARILLIKIFEKKLETGSRYRDMVTPLPRNPLFFFKLPVTRNERRYVVVSPIHELWDFFTFRKQIQQFPDLRYSSAFKYRSRISNSDHLIRINYPFPDCSILRFAYIRAQICEHIESPRHFQSLTQVSQMLLCVMKLDFILHL